MTESAQAGPVSDVLDEGPLFHGTKADLHVSELLQAWRDRLRVILEEERGEIIN